MENAGFKAYEELFDEIVKIARVRGVKFGQLQVMDSVHLVADINLGRINRGRGRVRVPGTKMPSAERKEIR